MTGPETAAFVIFGGMTVAFFGWGVYLTVKK